MRRILIPQLPQSTPCFGGGMPCDLATPYKITNDERVELEALAQFDPKLNIAAAKAIAILAIEQGEELQHIADRLDLTLESVGRWRRNFYKSRVQGILRNGKKGRAPIARDKQTQPILDATRDLVPPNGRKWSCRSLAAQLNVSVAMVQRVWKTAGIDTHSLRDHAFSPPFRSDDRLRLLGCFFLGGRRAMVVEILKSTAMLDASWPHEPVVVATLGILGQCKALPARRQLKMQVEQQLCFLEEIDRRSEPDSKLRLITDSVDTFNHARIRRWLTKSGRFVVHFSSTARELLFDAEAALREFSQERFIHSIQANLAALTDGGQPLLIAPLDRAFSSTSASIGFPVFLPPQKS